MSQGPQRASHLHVAAMAEIHAAAFPPREAWGQDAIGLQLALPGTFGMVDQTGGMTLARVAYDEAELLTLAVLPEVRRQGVGRRLLRATMEMAQAHGARTMVLEVSVHNAAARALYAAAGFIPIGQRPRYYADGADALILRATL